jgi:hypothetical protein
LNTKQAEILRDLIDLLEREGAEVPVITSFEDEEEGLTFELAVHIPKGGKK